MLYYTLGADMVLRFGVKNIEENLLFFTRTITVTSSLHKNNFSHATNQWHEQDGYQEPTQTSNMEFFVKTVHG